MREQDPSLPAPLFFTLAGAEPTREFFAQLWPAARAVADPDQYFYREFQLGHGSLGKYLRPGVWLAGLRALFKGNGVGRPVGDPLTLPGLFLVREGKIIAAHNFRHAGDHPHWPTVADQVRAASTSSRAE